MLELLTELQNAEFSLVTLLRSDSTTGAFPVISKILETLKYLNACYRSPEGDIPVSCV